VKIIVIGGTGLIGSKVMRKLQDSGFEVVAASRTSGINTMTGRGLADGLAKASVVIDLSNPPTFDGAAALEFFETSTKNQIAAESAAGVRHHVALSIVGCDRMTGSGYLRAKVAQEKLIRSSPIPYSIVRATQFFEFMNALMGDSADDKSVRLPSVHLQPIASADVVDAVVEVATGAPLYGIWNVAGPDVYSLDELGRVTLAAHHDKRTVVTDDGAGTFGGVTGDALTASDGAHLARTHYQDWLRAH